MTWPAFVRSANMSWGAHPWTSNFVCLVFPWRFCLFVVGCCKRESCLLQYQLLDSTSQVVGGHASPLKFDVHQSVPCQDSHPCVNCLCAADRILAGDSFSHTCIHPCQFSSAISSAQGSMSHQSQFQHRAVGLIVAELPQEEPKMKHRRMRRSVSPCFVDQCLGSV